MHSTSIDSCLPLSSLDPASVAPMVSVAAARADQHRRPRGVARSVGAVVALTGSGAPNHWSRRTDQRTPAPTVTHGMLAAEVAGTGNYGAPLISGCAWATWVTNCSNLTAYGNGGSASTTSGADAPNGCEFGPEFQCRSSPSATRTTRGVSPRTGTPYGATGGANTMWQAGPTLPIPLAQFANGAGTPPMQGDLMIFAPGWLGSYWDGSGHVAVVRDVGPGYVDVVEQNATSSGTDRFPLSGSRVTANGYTPIIGWLRETEQTPVELSASNVAATPQSVSDQPGDMDVVWRGADSKLYDLAYRNEAWQSQPAVAITPG